MSGGGITDSRRLTGANLFLDQPAAIVEVSVADAVAADGMDAAIGRWSEGARQLLRATDHAAEQTRHRRFDGGVSLLISAPIDALYAMCELNEVAWRWATGRADEPGRPRLVTEAERLRAAFAAERCPRLLEIQQLAKAHGAPFLWDDDAVSIGYGAGCQVWPRDQLPAPGRIDWSAVSAVPLALVTGTNGKSTTVRMLAAIMNAAGLRGGLTSTDDIRVGDQVLDTGDYSGPGGARMLLRDPRVEAAVLEVARGGLLRRGLGVGQADAAAITNVAADHLGEYGINTVADLVEAKFIVQRALPPQAPLVLNADDAGIVAYAKRLSQRIWWFSSNPGNPQVRAGLDDGQGGCWVEDGWLVGTAGTVAEAVAPRRLASLAAVPATRAGSLAHNVQNAMAATLLALALGLPDEAVGAGLAAFQGNEHDNPGRGNWFEHHGVTIVVDFAHNEHGLLALASSIRARDPARVLLLLSQAGDRSDEAIAGLLRAALTLSPARLLLCDLPGYERGRAPGEVPRLMQREAVRSGLAAESITLFRTPLAAAEQALGEARAGDVLVLLALTQRPQILQRIREFIDG